MAPSNYWGGGLNQFLQCFCQCCNKVVNFGLQHQLEFISKKVNKLVTWKTEMIYHLWIAVWRAWNLKTTIWMCLTLPGARIRIKALQPALLFIYYTKTCSGPILGLDHFVWKYGKSLLKFVKATGMGMPGMLELLELYWLKHCCLVC